MVRVIYNSALFPAGVHRVATLTCRSRETHLHRACVHFSFLISVNQKNLCWAGDAVLPSCHSYLQLNPVYVGNGLRCLS